MEFGVSAVPANWYMYDYDDSLWEMSKSYGMNYQNNSYQIFDHERFSIHLNAQWLWTQNNAKTNIFCRKKNKHVQPIHVHVHVPLTTSVPPAAENPISIFTNELEFEPIVQAKVIEEDVEEEDVSVGGPGREATLGVTELLALEDADEPAELLATIVNV
jgi:hypothetical protein